MQYVGEEYFNFMDKNLQPYTLSGLAMALDFESIAMLRKYSELPEYSGTLKRLLLRIENQCEKFLYYKESYPAAVYMLTNGFFWGQSKVDYGKGFYGEERQMLNIYFDRQKTTKHSYYKRGRDKQRTLIDNPEEVEIEVETEDNE
jgi:hypothetical protein